jgi:DNA helicase IV
VRLDGEAPSVAQVPAAELPAAVASAVAAVRHRHHNSGIVAPETLHEPIASALAAVGLTAVDRVHDLAHGDVPVFHAEAVKGLEFDGVVVVNPHQIFEGSERGARLLYVAVTRAVQVLQFVTDAPLPAALSH